jgi:transcriptional regulator with XRE-family HTH domain
MKNSENPALDIARRIAGLRDACGYSQEQLADALSLDHGLYKSYEATGKDIPISIIFEIANMFGVDFNEILTGVEAKLDRLHIVRAGEGELIERFAGYDYRDLAYRFTHKIMQPLLVTILPGDAPAELVSHIGQEFNYVVSGVEILTLGGKDYVLGTGDSVYFDPELPHGQRCGSDIPTVFLTMIAE